jgi:hypothetical protein
MFYTIYRVTNKINNKVYIGKHQTKDLKDGYMGSGKHLKRSIGKYGIDNFNKEILFVFDNEADMNSKEAELVTEEFTKEDTNYNLCPGGKGGWGYINSLGKNLYGMNGRTSNTKSNLEKARETQKFLRENDLEWATKTSKNISRGVKKRIDETGSIWLGRNHKPNTKKKISAANKGKTPWNKGGHHTFETKKKISDSLKKNTIPEVSSDVKMCKECYNKIKFEDMNIENTYWIEKYHNSEIKSIRKFVKESGYPKSHVTFSKILKNN